MAWGGTLKSSNVGEPLQVVTVTPGTTSVALWRACGCANPFFISGGGWFGGRRIGRGSVCQTVWFGGHRIG
eukprot:12423417-Alexandrium_andersonii.AAC.1